MRPFGRPRILFDIWHPAHAHFFRRTILNLRRDGFNVTVAARLKEDSLSLLEDFKIEHEVVGGHGKTLRTKAGLLPSTVSELLQLCRDEKPDIICGIGDIYGALASKLSRSSSIVFTDTERVRIVNPCILLAAKYVFVPTSFRGSFGWKEIRYPGYQALAYINPDDFVPGSLPQVAKGNPRDPLVVLRFVSWEAIHDRPGHGLSQEDKLKLLQFLSQRARLVITSEAKLAAELEPYRMTAAPSRIHDLLYHSDLFIGDSGAMSSEAALLGVPTLRFHSLKSGVDHGVFRELRERYQLVRPVGTIGEAIEAARAILEDPESKPDAHRRAQCVFSEKINPGRLLTWMLENWDESSRALRRGNLDYERFHFERNAWS